MASPPDLESRIVERGRELFALASSERASLFDTGAWIGKVMDWCMRDERFKVRMFRFVDVFPALRSGQQVVDHLREHFADSDELPAVLSWGARAAGAFGALGGAVLGKAISANIRGMGRQFIVGETTREAVAGIARLRRDGFAAVVDVLGEATLSDQEAEAYVQTYLELLDAMAAEQAQGRPLAGKAGGAPALDWGHAPRINVALKPTALYGLASPQDFAGSVTAILARARRILDRVVAAGGYLCLDMESYRHKDIILEVYRRLRLERRDYPHLGIVLQSYLRDTDRDLAELIAWARRERVAISVRLVKGAYWDYETVCAAQNGWAPPVWTAKAQSDAAFERQARALLAAHDLCHFACASHNLRSIAAVLEHARDLGVPEERYEFQVLYGMAEPVRKAILAATGRTRLYCPYGDLVPGMGYLVRRLLENTANESFLRQGFAEGAALDRLLADPAAAPQPPVAAPPTGFTNEPAADFTRTDLRAAFPAAIAAVRGRLGRVLPLVIGGREVTTAERLPSHNPARPDEVIALACQASPADAGAALAAARAAFPAWRTTPVTERAACLHRAAAAARARQVELAAWQVLEIGKQWDQAHADVAEAIDFLEYYAHEMPALAASRGIISPPGEANRLTYEPKGVAVVIAPWNFPLAIATGMAAAAIVAGNAVVFKPSGLTPAIGWLLIELFRAAGLPPGVLNFLPGRGSAIGDLLVDSPEVDLIAFTGSMEVGLRIIGRAATVHPGQRNVKKVVCEMGGKNAIIIDDDADLDEAVPQVLASAFSFQGQKCSACSRVIVLDAVHDAFVARLLAAARLIRVGPAEDPANGMGPVADAAAQRSILAHIEVGKREGTALYQSPVPDGGGHFVPLTILGGIRPEHRVAQEEIFGPVLAVMRARDLDQAIAWANSTRFALTAGIFSRSPAHLARARRELAAGNVYLNRGITGALVARQPFGGAAMSGVGTKAGGPDYLLHFTDPRVVTENTLRRGFAAAEESGV